MLFENIENVQVKHDARYSTLVFDLPVTYTGRSRLRERRLQPTLALRSPEGIVIPQEIWVWSGELAEVKELKSAHQYVAALGRLYDFWMATGSRRLETGHDVDLLIDSYILYRTMAPSDPAKRIFPNWKPVAIETVKTDLRAIESFVKSCRRNQGDKHVMSQALQKSGTVFETRIPKQRGTSFWSHLDDQYEKYAQLKPETAVFPVAYNRLATFSSKIQVPTPVMCEEVGRRIIECTKDRDYKHLFMAMMGTGGRKSEYLHMYRCDVQPARMSKRFMNFQSTDTLLIFAHPEQSTWCGVLDPSSLRVTREDYLRRQFDISSRRKSLKKSDMVGWKGMRFTDHRLFRIPVWTHSDYAAQLEAYAMEMRQFAIKAGVNSPYLFLTTANRTNRGDMLRVGNVDKAFKSACGRAGVRGMPGIFIHGFRHAYVRELRLRGLSPHLIALGLGHFSIDTQEEYGVDLQMVYDAVKGGGRANVH